MTFACIILDMKILFQSGHVSVVMVDECSWEQGYVYANGRTDFRGLV